VWSPDGRWLAYSITGANQQSGIWLYSLDTRKATQVSDPRFNDFQPAFDGSGKYLFFISTRHENPTFSRAEFNVATLKTTGIYVTTLKRGATSLFAPRSDEGALEEQKKDEKKDEKKKEDRKPEVKAVEIDLDGLMARSVPMPIPPADISYFDVRDDKVFYLTGPSQMIEGPLPTEKPVLHVYDLKERKDANIVEGLSSYVVSADGKKVLYKLEKDYIIADAAPAKGRDEEGKKKLDLSHMRVRVEPTQEWAEMFSSAWRLERDFFYSTKMNGVDWQAVRTAYAKLLPLAGSRGDVNYLIGEVLGELGNSHTYVSGGDEMPEERKNATAYLGTDFVLDAASGRYKFATVFPGDNTRDKYRSPLAAPGVDVHAGEYLLAVDGQDLKAPTDPYSLLVGKQDFTVKLTVSDAPNGKRRDVVVQPVKNEVALREQAWIDHNREVVDKASAGKVAYI
jgi:tricorn protease